MLPLESSNLNGAYMSRPTELPPRVEEAPNRLTLSAFMKGSVSAQIGRIGKQLRACAEGGAVELGGTKQE